MFQKNAKQVQHFFTPDTQSYLYSYRPLFIYLYPYDHYPYYALNPLVRGLCCRDQKFQNASNLFQLTEDPHSADFFLFPSYLDYFEHHEHDIFPLLEHYRGNEDRHIFFDDRDHPGIFPSKKSICFKVSLHKEDVSENVFCMPYVDMADDFYFNFLKKREIKYDLSFVGQATEKRQAVIDRLKKRNLRIYDNLRKKFFHQHFVALDSESPDSLFFSEERLHARDEYIKTILASKFALAIRGHGLNSFRFYEALSLGVPPILISNNCALPYEDLIDYDSFLVQFDIDDPDLDLKLTNLLKETSDEDYDRMCKLCRFHYDTYFAPRHFNYLLYNKLSNLI